MPSFIVVTRTFYEPEVRERVLAAAHASYPIFQKQAGLVAIRMHEDHEHTHTMTVMEWQTKEAHEACLRSPDFADWSTEWEALIATGKARWELHTYQAIAV